MDNVFFVGLCCLYRDFRKIFVTCHSSILNTFEKTMSGRHSLLSTMCSPLFEQCLLLCKQQDISCAQCDFKSPFHVIAGFCEIYCRHVKFHSWDKYFNFTQWKIFFWHVLHYIVDSVNWHIHEGFLHDVAVSHEGKEKVTLAIQFYYVRPWKWQNNKSVKHTLDMLFSWYWSAIIRVASVILFSLCFFFASCPCCQP